MNTKLERLCREYTDLSPYEIGEVADAAKRLGNIASMFDADAFIDCLINDKSGNSIVVAEAKPIEKPSSYVNSVVGKIAKKENEPAVYRTFRLGVPTKHVKAITQENVNVVQTVEPIFSDSRVIAVYIIEQKMEQISMGQLTVARSLGDKTIDMDIYKGKGQMEVDYSDAIGEGILFVDDNGIISYINKQAKTIFRRLGYLGEMEGVAYKDVSFITETDEERARPYFEGEMRIGGSSFLIKRQDIEKNHVSYIINISDVTAKNMQRDALVLKSAAFKEMHHRIKNNLQTVISLLRLERNKLTASDGREAIENTVNRLLAISNIHEIMLQTEIESVRLNDILTRIKDNTLIYCNNDDFHLELECHGGDFSINLDKTTAIALILNELIQNSIKYAFPGEKSGKILISAYEKKEGKIEIRFKDNGVGFDVEEKLKQGTIGWNIIRLVVAEKLKGTLLAESGKEGTRVTIVF